MKKSKKQRLAENKAKKEAYRKSRERKFHKREVLREFIKKQIRNLIVEQTATQCSDIINQGYSGQGYFFSCCEMGYYGSPPGTPNANNPFGMNDSACKQYMDYGIVTHGLTPNEVANCCDPNWGTGTDGDCDDPLWVGMPAPNKTEYCNRCSETGGGIAANGSFMVTLMAGAPYYDPNNPQFNYCKCCDDGSSGDMDCDNPEWVAQNPGAARKCYVCREAPAPCEQISNIPGMTVAIAQGMGLTLYNDQASCNSSTECGPSTGNRCDQMTQGVYDPDDPNHNDGWGMGCWFCHPEEGHPDFPGCTMITTPMSQWNAYNAYVAGTTGIYTTNAACQADPITKCGDEDPRDEIYCECCSGDIYGQAQSMAQTVASPADCIGAENTVYAGLNVHSCAVSPVSGGPGTGTSCGKKPIPTDIPIDMDDMEPMPMVKPERPGSDDIKRSLREMLKRLKK